MEWLDGIEKHPSQGWKFRCLGKHGELRLCSMREVHDVKLPQVNSLKRQAITLRFEDGELTNAQEYLSYWGWETSVSSQHQIYAYQVGNVRYLIPAFLLWRALIRPLRALLPFALQTKSLNSFCVRTAGENVGVVFWPGVLSGRVESESDRIQMSWLHSFPSANKAWLSILAYASAGQLGFSVPLGTGKCIIKGEKLQNTFYVTALTAISLVTNEAPFPHEVNHPRELQFHIATPVVRSSNSHFPKRIQSSELGSRGSAPLSDAEWKKIEPILFSSDVMRRKYPLRVTADAVLQKLATGVPWKDMPLDTISWNDAYQHYRRWLKSGKLQRVIEELQKKAA